jgi:hypothetical protein
MVYVVMSEGPDGDVLAVCVCEDLESAAEIVERLNSTDLPFRAWSQEADLLYSGKRFPCER